MFEIIIALLVVLFLGIFPLLLLIVVPMLIIDALFFESEMAYSIKLFFNKDKNMSCLDCKYYGGADRLNVYCNYRKEVKKTYIDFVTKKEKEYQSSDCSFCKNRAGKCVPTRAVK